MCLFWHSPPGKKEEPYLTEAGREAFDKFYRLREGELQLFSNTILQLPQLVLMKESELVKDVLNVLIGVVSATFSLNQVRIIVLSRIRSHDFVVETAARKINTLNSKCHFYWYCLQIIPVFFYTLQKILFTSKLK